MEAGDRDRIERIWSVGGPGGHAAESRPAARRELSRSAPARGRGWVFRGARTRWKRKPCIQSTGGTTGGRPSGTPCRHGRRGEAMSSSHQWDVVAVGSGFGGSVTALRLYTSDAADEEDSV